MCACFRNYISVDIDECLNTVCSHECTNTEGSYVCSCPDGLFLDDNERSCSGIIDCVDCNVHYICVVTKVVETAMAAVIRYVHKTLLVLHVAVWMDIF